MHHYPVQFTENESNLESFKINLQPADLKRYFLSHLNKIYCAKKHLAKNLPAIMNLATSADLKEAIIDTSDDIRTEIVRMDEIFEIIKEIYEPGTCQFFSGLIEDLFNGVKQEEGNPVLQDMGIIYYLQNVESLEMASFHAMQMAALKFKNDDINRLLKDNFDQAKAERTLLRLLTAKFLTS
jgi:ferritin-like metal-binding protein YciE